MSTDVRQLRWDQERLQNRIDQVNHAHWLLEELEKLTKEFQPPQYQYGNGTLNLRTAQDLVLEAVCSAKKATLDLEGEINFFKASNPQVIDPRDPK